MTDMNNKLAVIDNTNELMFNPEAMNSMLKLADLMASSKVSVPAHFRGSPGDCLAVILQSALFKMNPFAVAQKTFLVNGILGYEAQLINGIVVNSGAIKSRFEYEFFGDWNKVQGKTKEVESKTKMDDAGRPKKFRVPAWSFEDEKGIGVTVSAVLSGETEPRKLTLLMTQALTRNSTLWSDDPQQQLSYLAVKKWARRYVPDVILGIYSTDELETIETPEEKIINPTDGKAPDNHDVFSYENLIKKIAAHPNDNFDFFSVKQMRDAGFTPEQVSSVRAACAARRQELINLSVVSTQTAQPQTAAPKNPSTDKETDWVDITKNAESEQELAAIAQSMPETAVKAVIDGLTNSGKLQKFFLALPKEVQVKFNDDMDTAMDFLSSVAKGMSN